MGHLQKLDNIPLRGMLRMLPAIWHRRLYLLIFGDLGQLDRIFSFEVVRMDNSVLTVIRMNYSVFNSHEDG